MARITGIGGIFFKAQDPALLGTWYREHLGIEVGEGGHAVFERSDDPAEETSTFAIFPADTTYFSPGNSSFMINFRVDDLPRVLLRLRELGDTVDEHTGDEEYGRFAWVVDPEGNRIELWEPAAKG